VPVSDSQSTGVLPVAGSVPAVVTGFEPVDILRGVLMCVEQLENGLAEVKNAYARAVRPAGNVTCGMA
jgi:hydrogenase expression/formation protein HypD